MLDHKGFLALSLSLTLNVPLGIRRAGNYRAACNLGGQIGIYVSRDKSGLHLLGSFSLSMGLVSRPVAW